MSMKIKDLQNIILEIMRDVDKLCRENDIEYWILAGTLLGAVRHKGFIPWDDDLDIGMLRGDYEKFIEICKTQLPDHLEAQNYETDSEILYSWFKIRYKDSKFSEYGMRDREKLNGIFIDIFPMDVCVELEERKKLKESYKKVQMVSSGLSSLEMPIIKNIKINTKFLIQKIGSLLYLGKKKEDFYKEILKISSNYCLKEYDPEKSFIDYGLETPFYSEPVRYNDVFPLKEIEFEGVKFYGPNNYKECLEVAFGSNYMELPPEEQRVWHHKSYIINKDGYYTKNIRK